MPISPLQPSDISIAAGSRLESKIIIPDRNIDDLSEDTYTYSFLYAPDWLRINPSYSDNSNTIYGLRLTNTDSIELLSSRNSPTMGYFGSAWKAQYGYVRAVSQNRVGSQILSDSLGDVVAKNPLYSNIDLFGVNKVNNPFQAAWTRIIYEKFGNGNFTFQDISDAENEVGGTGYYTNNGDGTYKLNQDLTPAAWKSPLPSRYRLLGGGTLTRTVTPQMQIDWNAYWDKWDGFDYSKKAEFNDWSWIPSINFARGKLYRINQTNAIYRWFYSIEYSIAPSLEIPRKDYIVTIRTTNNTTGEFVDVPWTISVTQPIEAPIIVPPPPAPTAPEYNVKLVKTSELNFDSYIASAEDAMGVYNLNGIYENSPDTYKVSFDVKETDMSSTIENPMEIFSNVLDIKHYAIVPGTERVIEGFEVVQTNPSTIEISGKVKDVFTNQIFQFLKEDLKTIETSSSYIDDFTALISWTPPSTKMLTINHIVDVKIKGVVPYTEDAEYRFTLTQDIHWNYTTAVNAFRENVNKGII